MLLLCENQYQIPEKGELKCIFALQSGDTCPQCSSFFLIRLSPEGSSDGPRWQLSGLLSILSLLPDSDFLLEMIERKKSTFFVFPSIFSHIHSASYLPTYPSLIHIPIQPVI